MEMIFKVVAICALVACCRAGAAPGQLTQAYVAPFSGGGGGGGGGYADYDDGGHSGAYEPPKPYEFGYAVRDYSTGNDYTRREASDGNTVHGEYRVALPDGRIQVVSYTADWQNGYQARVRYEGAASHPDVGGGVGGGAGGDYYSGSGFQQQQQPQPPVYGPPSQGHF
ncbi:pro-resilin-like [Schistocerca gregaria]|uniref:pro-resilin-like n=1 Tax=Schistocerca gregaria TaxID=7010 RepID=UPI00211E5579|nr:pro-resilin-like [Schistocerca gregaria]